MKYLSKLLISRIGAGRDLRRPGERRRIGFIESWTSIGANLFLAVLKLVFGLLTNSIAMVADAVHSASDIFSSVVVLFGFFLAGRKPDREHPHGHGRTEYLAGLIIALMLIGAGGVFIYQSYTRLSGESLFQPSLPAVAAVIGAIVVKEFLFQFSAGLGKLIDSEALAGDAWHHRSDALSSLLVLAALVGGFFGVKDLDAYLGFGVALFVIFAGYKIARSSCSLLLGRAPDEHLVTMVAGCAAEIEGVVETHNLEVHDYGSWKVVTMHIGVNGKISLGEAHAIAHMVEDRVSARFHCDTIVHLDPR